VLSFEILPIIILDAETWNMVLHWEMNLHTVLVLSNFAHFKERLIQIPFWNYRGISTSWLQEQKSIKISKDCETSISGYSDFTSTKQSQVLADGNLDTPA
ncbi:hypothetical protein HDU92_006765, partial [Lobulomyces angularis]